MQNDPFAVLGLSSSATEDEIKAAYRKLAKKYHPDLNPGDKTAEAKMRQINEAYTQALQWKKNGGPSYSGYQSGFGPNGGNPWQQEGGNSSYGYRTQSESYSRREGNPFQDFGFGFNPFSDFFDTHRQTGFRSRAYAHPDLQTAAQYILANRFADAVSLLNRVPVHDADWHALYARADIGLGNRISALDHARSAVSMNPNDSEYQSLLNSIESSSQAYRRTQYEGGYDFRSLLCGNPCLTCCAANILLNCCLGFGRYGLFC